MNTGAKIAHLGSSPGMMMSRIAMTITNPMSSQSGPMFAASRTSAIATEITVGMFE
jgi:hypothetical protein